MPDIFFLFYRVIHGPLEAKVFCHSYSSGLWSRCDASPYGGGRTSDAALALHIKFFWNVKVKQTRRKRADLFMVCSRSANKSVADLQIVYRSPTDYLQIICGMSAEYLHAWSANSLLNCRRSADDADFRWRCRANELQTNSRHKADEQHQSYLVYFKTKEYI